MTHASGCRADTRVTFLHDTDGTVRRCDVSLLIQTSSSRIGTNITSGSTLAPSLQCDFSFDLFIHSQFYF